ncbi:nitroreductase family protein [Proteus mirabilis]|uniref:nitroreductase family protein n=1 Tax=Proteus mirabilis TaxID=584 RepID=UPI0018C61AA1|nr:nitroreductase family protein [Proteus mirabilis]MBJ5789584.1 nitroreductase family protein [Salmonella enterica subsp. enterica serovar Agona]ELA9905157.1 nitroreductase family protein [Proteus mirabilis]MBG2799139.1 nitroreductase family protein [Proteus mirabilis]MBG6045099.1 nitroreductase family protein [Proteus mirabilis]MBI6412384.1 nitroreductase family protein [Proteus mirabilis]
MLLNRIKPIGRLAKYISGALYDFIRFFKHGGWKIDLKNKEERNYYVVKVYHSLEKSMSFTSHNVNSGWKNAKLLTMALEAAVNNNNIGFHDKIGCSVLLEFLDKNKLAKDSEHKIYILKKINYIIDAIEIENNKEMYGIKNMSYDELNGSNFIHPEEFFNSRYSVREFSKKEIPNDILIKAIQLSLKTPSACNRQSWHVYHLSDEKDIKNALKYQNGNKGFNDKISNLLIICSDLQAFNSGGERYQHWIDGGMYAMSLIYTLHSMGISSCCLNWSCQPKQDLQLKKVFPLISKNHTIIMMLAIGYPKNKNNICVSPRRPLYEIYTRL